MPYRVQTLEDGLVQYLDKHGDWTPNLTKARIYSGLGPLKNSIGDWHEDDTELPYVQVVEVELRETGKVMTAQELIAPVRAKRQAEIDARTSTERLRERNQELAELKRLKEKYGPGGF